MLNFVARIMGGGGDQNVTADIEKEMVKSFFFFLNV